MRGWQKELQTFFNSNLQGDYLADEPLLYHTWYKIGGPVDFLVFPKNQDDLDAVLNKCQSFDVETYLIGQGANLLVHDDGFCGVMINLERYFNKLYSEDNKIVAEAGVSLEDLVMFAEKTGLGGIECLSGIPGTVGGALVMNAGTNSGEIGSSVNEVSYLNKHLELMTLSSDKISFGYRDVPELQEKYILKCKLELSAQDPKFLKAFRLNQIENRAAKQPLEFPSCGSVFKRPPGFYVGKLVQDVGLRGFKYGGAMIPEKHGGFIINLGNAKAVDVKYIIEKTQDEVYKNFGVRLDPEVKFVGF